jgi:hypothetical protein
VTRLLEDDSTFTYDLFRLTLALIPTIHREKAQRGRAAPGSSVIRDRRQTEAMKTDQSKLKRESKHRIGDYDELIRASCDGFFGYGPATAPVWFIGKQWGGGKTTEEVCRRLEAWHQRRRPVLDDIVGYHRAIRDENSWFRGDPPEIQRTWGELIRVRLAMASEPISEPSIARYQAEQMAGWNGENCLLELLPLASTQPENTEVYARISRLAWLSSGSALIGKYGQKRAQILKEMISQHGPKAVIFYSSAEKYIRFWRSIVEADFKETTVSQILSTSYGATTYFIMPHPVRVQRRPDLYPPYREFFSKVGRLIAARLRETAYSPQKQYSLVKRRDLKTRSDAGNPSAH